MGCGEKEFQAAVGSVLLKADWLKRFCLESDKSFLETFSYYPAEEAVFNGFRSCQLFVQTHMLAPQVRNGKGYVISSPLAEASLRSRIKLM